jgi:hypothetical protein
MAITVRNVILALIAAVCIALLYYYYINLYVKSPLTPAAKVPAAKAPASKAPATKAPAAAVPATKAPATKAPKSAKAAVKQALDTLTFHVYDDTVQSSTTYHKMYRALVGLTTQSQEKVLKYMSHMASGDRNTGGDVATPIYIKSSTLSTEKLMAASWVRYGQVFQYDSVTKMLKANGISAWNPHAVDTKLKVWHDALVKYSKKDSITSRADLDAVTKIVTDLAAYLLAITTTNNKSKIPRYYEERIAVIRRMAFSDGSPSARKFAVLKSQYVDNMTLILKASMALNDTRKGPLAVLAPLRDAADRKAKQTARAKRMWRAHPWHGRRMGGNPDIR